MMRRIRGPRGSPPGASRGDRSSIVSLPWLWMGAIAAATFASPGIAAPPRVAPEVTAERWLNSDPLSRDELRGRVVLVEFWTFACWNCKNVEPYVKQWHEKYADDGLVIVAVHTPELSIERDLSNVRAYVDENGIDYPVAVDNDFSTWKAFGNWAWPTLYLIDKQGVIRHTKVGEGGYQDTEDQIRRLLNSDAGTDVRADVEMGVDMNTDEGPQPHTD